MDAYLIIIMKYSMHEGSKAIYNGNAWVELGFEFICTFKLNTGFKTYIVFNKNNVNYYKPTVFSCGSGVTACVLGLAYFLISDKNAVIYDGSFSEWGEK